eukprot:scaffold585_cov97-Cylindrotheca_fusiformis.AAC.2
MIERKYVTNNNNDNLCFADYLIRIRESKRAADLSKTSIVSDSSLPHKSRRSATTSSTSTTSRSTTTNTNPYCNLRQQELRPAPSKQYYFELPPELSFEETTDDHPSVTPDSYHASAAGYVSSIHSPITDDDDSMEDSLNDSLSNEQQGQEAWDVPMEVEDGAKMLVDLLQH